MQWLPLVREEPHTQKGALGLVRGLVQVEAGSSWKFWGRWSEVARVRGLRQPREDSLIAEPQAAPGLEPLGEPVG